MSPGCSCPARALTLAQEGIWYAYVTKEQQQGDGLAQQQQEKPPSSRAADYSFHLALEYHLSLDGGQLDLASAVAQLVRDHALLRTSFVPAAETAMTVHELKCAWLQGEQKRVVEEAWATAHRVAPDDADECDASMTDDAERTSITADIKAPFDLGHQVPFRLHCRLAAGERTLRLLFVVHHVVCDGYSLPLVHRSLLQSLANEEDEGEAEPDAAVQNKSPVLSPSSDTSKKDLPASGLPASSPRDFWHQHIRDSNMSFQLASNRLADPPQDQEPYGVIDLPELPPEVLARANRLQADGASVFSLCSTALWQVLRHMAGLDDESDDDEGAFPIGMSFLARPSGQAPDAGGVSQASNALPVCFRPPPHGVADLDDHDGLGLVRRMHACIQACKAHESYDAVQLARDVHSSTSLFRNGITVLPAFAERPPWLTRFRVHLFTEDDLMAVVVRGRTRDQWSLRLVYNATRYTSPWANRFAEAMQRQVTLLLAPTPAIKPLPWSHSPRLLHPLHTPSSAARLLLDLQTPANPRIRHMNLWAMVRAAACAHGGRPAIVQHGEAAAGVVTYSELVGHVDRLSRALAERVSAGSVIALLGSKSSSVVVGMLAVAAVGAVYMCVDVETLDANRVRHMLMDSEPECVVDLTDAADLSNEQQRDGQEWREMAPHCMIVSAQMDKIEWVSAPKTSLVDSPVGLTLAFSTPTASPVASPMMITTLARNISSPTRSPESAPMSPVYLSSTWPPVQVPSPLLAPLSWPASLTASRSTPPADSVYVKYTSGTTGKPKGVFLTHDGVCSMLLATQVAFRVQPTDRVMLFSSISFDASVWQIFSALTAGAAVVIPSGGDVLGCIADMRITVLDTVPSVANAMDPARFPHLRVLQLGAEACPTHLALKWTRWADAHPAQGLMVLNSYGPTEVACMTHSSRMRSTWAQRVAIGRGLANVRMYILNAARELVLEGAVGTIWVAGPGVAPEGYWKQPELTARAFHSDPFAKAEDSATQPPAWSVPLMYNTGDLGRWVGDDSGLVECLGRRDHQVKWHGCRVELAQLEQVALACRADLGLAECCAVFYRGDPAAGSTGAGADSLVLYMTLEEPVGDDQARAVEAQMRDHFRRTVAAYMLPSHYHLLKRFERNSSDKVDRTRLPRPPFASDLPAAATATVSANGADSVAVQLAGIWSRVLHLESSFVLAQQASIHFFEAGGSSLQLMVLLDQIKRVFAVPRLSVAELFVQPYFQQMANMLAACQRPPVAQAEPEVQAQPPPSPELERVHIIAYDGLFPVADQDGDGRPDARAFWQHLRTGQVVSARASSKSQGQADNFVPVFGRLSPRLWEAEFSLTTFGLSRKEAAHMDPQQRLLVECTFQALLRSGLRGGDRNLRIGTFVAIADSSYKAPTGDDASPAEAESVKDRYQRISNNMSATAATRLAYTFDLRGPALSIQTACSSFGVALDAAVQAIRHGRCEAAVVGASSVRLPQEGHAWQEGMVFSCAGQCRPFEQRSDGITLANACGALVLCSARALARVPAAVAIAEVVETAVNNDGRAADKLSFAAPSLIGEMDVMTRVLAARQRRAKEDGQAPAPLAFVEAHGTGTAVGDPVELHAIAQVLRAHGEGPSSSPSSPPRRRVVVSSVKGSIGHCDTAAGFVGVVKALMCLEARLVPRQPDFQQVNKGVGADDLEVVQILDREDRELGEEERDALVNCFGIGGSNAAVLLRRPLNRDQAPPVPMPPAPTDDDAQADRDNRAAILWPVSHETPALCREWLASLLHHAGGRVAMARSVSRALWSRWKQRNTQLPSYMARRLAAHEAVLVWTPSLSTEDNLDQHVATGQGSVAVAGAGTTNLVYLFTGQGALDLAHVRSLFAHHVAYRASLTRTFDGLKHLAPLIAVWLPVPLADGVEAWLQAPGDPGRHEVVRQQWLGFGHAVALFSAWAQSGQGASTSRAAVGHSLGEYAARHCAGELGLLEALLLIAIRSELASRSRTGQMLAVQCDEKQVRDWIGQQPWANADSDTDSRISVAAVNATDQVVVAGAPGAVDTARAWCESRGIKSRALASNGVAYHSHLLRQAAEESATKRWLEECRALCEAVRQMDAAASAAGPSTSASQLRVFSTFRATSPEPLTDSLDWMMAHLLAPVNFLGATQQLIDAAPATTTVWVEMGDRPILLRHARRAALAGHSSAGAGAAAAQPPRHQFVEVFSRAGDEASDQLQWQLARCQLALATGNGDELQPTDKASATTRGEGHLPCFPLARPSKPLHQRSDKAADVGSPAQAATVRSLLDQAAAAPTPLRDQVRQLFFRVLGASSEGEADSDPDFLLLGGDSMSAIELLAGFRQLVPDAAARLTSAEFLSRPTLSRLIEISEHEPTQATAREGMEVLWRSNSSVSADLDQAPRPSRHELVCLVAPVGGTLFLYRDYVTWMRTHGLSRDAKTTTTLLGFRYDPQAGRGVETLADHYRDQLCATLRGLAGPDGPHATDVSLVVIGLSYGGLVAQHMLGQASSLASLDGALQSAMPLALLSSIRLAMIDTPTPCTLAERAYRRDSARPFTPFDALKYTFVDMLEVRHPEAVNEATVAAVEDEAQLAALVCAAIGSDQSGFEDLEQQARIYLQDVDSIRNYRFPAPDPLSSSLAQEAKAESPSPSASSRVSASLFVCSSPRAMDPRGHAQAWRERCGGSLNIHDTPGDHISMNFEPILSEHIIARIFADRA